MIHKHIYFYVLPLSAGFCPSTVGSDGTVTNLPCPQGYGAILGTAAVCAFLEIGLSFLPPKVMQKIFPPIVTGTTVFLIGVSLITAGFQGWGGGAGPCIARYYPQYSSEAAFNTILLGVDVVKSHLQKS